MIYVTKAKMREERKNIYFNRKVRFPHSNFQNNTLK